QQNDPELAHPMSPFSQPHVSPNSVATRAKLASAASVDRRLAQADSETMEPNFRKLDKTEITVPPEAEGNRLDRFLAGQFPDYSRTLLASLVRDGLVSIEDFPPAKLKPSLKLEAGQVITLEKPALEEAELAPEDIPLDVLFEDDCIIVINKPADLPVHPPKAGRGGTLANALLFHFQKLSRPDPIRPGIVHRLDADTSGVIVCAKDDSAHFKLAKQFEQRTVKKEYLAIV